MHARQERRDPGRGRIIGIGRQAEACEQNDEGPLRGEKLSVGPIGSGVNVSAIAPRFGSAIVSQSTAASAMPGRPAV